MCIRDRPSVCDRIRRTRESSRCTKALTYDVKAVSYTHLDVYKRQVALSGDILHLETRFKDEELNQLEFLTMLYGNIRAERQASYYPITDFEDEGMTMTTDFDKNREEIEELMLRYLPLYMDDLRCGISVSYTHLCKDRP